MTDILLPLVAAGAVLAAWDAARRHFATEERKQRGQDDFAVLERKFSTHEVRTNAAIEDFKQKTATAHDALAEVVTDIRQRVAGGTVADFIGKRRG